MPSHDENIPTDQPKTRSLDEGRVSLDTDRQQRCGYPEVVYGEGKSFEAIASVFREQLGRGQAPFATRVRPEIANSLLNEFSQVAWNETARTIRIGRSSKPRGNVAVITAGTTDLPVAEEVSETLTWMGTHVTKINDVGVAGPHRLPSRLAEFIDCDSIVVVAGMEGALPSVVAGHVGCPVIAVPTSVGYGANFGGAAALLSMINSCAANVAVVNIDAGFKAGYLAGMIARQTAKSSNR